MAILVREIQRVHPGKRAEQEGAEAKWVAFEKRVGSPRRSDDNVSTPGPRIPSSSSSNPGASPLSKRLTNGPGQTRSIGKCLRGSALSSRASESSSAPYSTECRGSEIVGPSRICSIGIVHRAPSRTR